MAGTTDDPTPGFYGIRTPRYRYIELFTGEKELYDLSTDPFEVTNLAGRASHSTIQASLKTQLQRLKEASLGSRRPPMAGQLPAFVSASDR